MKISAVFIFSIFCFLQTFFILAASPAQMKGEVFPERSTFPVLQGMTDATSTQLSVLLPVGELFKIELSAQGSGKIHSAHKSHFVKREGSSWGIQKLYFNKLKLGEKYKLNILSNQGKLLDQRELELLELNKENFRVVVASCLDDAFKREQKHMWNQVFLQKPEMILLMGDNVYADRIGDEPIRDIDPDHLWKRYIQTWVRLDLFHQKKLIPVLATWDDHDFGKNNGGSEFKYKEESKNIFHSFFAQEGGLSPYLERGPGVSSLLKTKFFNVFFLDGRSFRVEGETHFGKSQEQWLMGHLRKSPNPSWLINGDQFFGGYHRFESYEGRNKKSFKNFLKNLSKLSSKVFFLSGDRHLTELMEVSKKELGYKTYEFTTSAIHAKVYPSRWVEQPNPRQLVGAAGIHNYGLLEVHARRGKHSIQITAYSFHQSVLFERELVLE